MEQRGNGTRPALPPTLFRAWCIHRVAAGLSLSLSAPHTVEAFRCWWRTAGSNAIISTGSSSFKRSVMCSIWPCWPATWWKKCLACGNTIGPVSWIQWNLQWQSCRLQTVEQVTLWWPQNSQKKAKSPIYSQWFVCSRLLQKYGSSTRWTWQKRTHCLFRCELLILRKCANENMPEYYIPFLPIDPPKCYTLDLLMRKYQYETLSMSSKTCPAL